PNISFAQIAELTGSEVSPFVGEQIEIAVKYAGYINRQHEDVAQMKRLEETRIPADFDYDIVSGLSREITLKLKDVRPETLAQASRIPGVTPAAVQLVMITIRKNAQAKKSAEDLKLKKPTVCGLFYRKIFWISFDYGSIVNNYY